MSLSISASPLLEQGQLAASERLLRGVAVATNTLLTTTDHHSAIQQAMATLGEATGVDRIYIFQYHTDPATDELLVSQRWEWVAEGVQPEIDNPLLQNQPDRQFVPRWTVEFHRGRPIVGLIKDFPANEQAVLAPQGIISILVVPIQLNDQVWGFVGFDQCKTAHQWSETEIITLWAIAGSFGGTIARHQAEQALQESNRTLEDKVQQRTRELTAAMEQADAANRAKSEFLANMSHELRTPLNGILGYAQILERTSTLPDKERRSIGIIHRCGTHLLSLINDILDLAKIEAGKIDLAPAPFPMPALLQSVVEICKVKADQKGLSFFYRPSPSLPVGVEVDEKHLRQVLINLVGNAIKFTDTGSVTLQVDVLDSAPGRSRLRFSVTDTGIGIEAADLERIFNAFEQLGDRQRPTEGTGLGLAISQRIVQLMGSAIQVTSQLGQGSEFTFEIDLPLAETWDDLSALPPEDPIVGYTGAPRTILLIDDHWENRSVLVGLLEPLGFQLLEAENGQEGLEQLRSHRPDLVITDLAMPVMDGFQFLSAVRGDADLRPCPIVVSSASVSQGDQQLALERGGDAFLPKPVEARSLFAVLAARLDLEWIYRSAGQGAHSPATPADNQPAVPPPAVLRTLLQLAHQDNVRTLRHQLEQLKQDSPQYAPFADTLLPLVSQFQTEAIEQRLTDLLARR